MNIIKHTILIIGCLAVSAANVLFYVHIHESAVRNEKQLLDLSSTSPKAQHLVGEFNLASESQKNEIFTNFLALMQTRDQRILSTANFSNEIQEISARYVYLFNSIVAICVITLYFRLKKQAAKNLVN